MQNSEAKSYKAIQKMILLLGFFCCALLLAQGCAASRQSPLHKAVLRGDKAAVEGSLQETTDVDAKDARGETALYLAAQDGNKEVVQLLLEKGAKPSKGAFWKGGNTPLHVAAAGGHAAVVAMLLDKSANIDQPNRHGQTALMLAAWGRHFDTVEVLLNHGADVNAADRFGWTALHSSLNAKPGDVRYEKVIELLMQHKAPVNARALDPLDFTPLMGAAYAGDKYAVEMLLKAGARINIQDDQGHTAYSIASRMKNDEIKALLIEHGAKPVLPITSYFGTKY